MTGTPIRRTQIAPLPPAGSGTGDLLAANNLSDVADVSTARINLGLEIGVDVAAAGSGGVADGDKGQIVVSGGVWTLDTGAAVANLGFTPYNAANPSGYLSSVNDANWSGADLAIANGGTGASTAAAARTNLGLGSVDNTADSAKSVASAATLTTPRTINGVSFNGSTNITVNAVDSTARLASSAVSAYGLTLIDDADAATARGTLGLGTLATQSGTFSGTSSGTNTGDQTTITGNAGSATVLQTARTVAISGKATGTATNFNGSANITIPITAVTLVAGDIPTIAQSQVTSLVSDLAAKQPLDAQLTSLAGLVFAGNAGKAVRLNAGETDFEFFTAAGSGTVTSVSVATANGISGSVATSTTTPAITLALGSITPNKVSITPTSTPASATTVDTLVIGEQSDNAGYKLKMGYYGGSFGSAIDSFVGGVGGVLDINPSGGLVRAGGALSVADAAFASGWNGSVEVPTKNAVYDALNPLAAAYRTILDCSGSHTAARVAGLYGFTHGQPLAITGTGTLYPLDIIYIDSADYPSMGALVAKLRIRCSLAVNDVAPTGNFTIALHPVTRPATSGAAGLAIYTIGAAVAGSGVTSTAPAADSLNNLVGADFALPANGHYVVAMTSTAAVAASSHLHFSAALQLHYA